MRLLGALLLLLAALPAHAAGGETILDFNSRITVKSDSTMIVTETIKVRSTASKIKHGIYRDFPTTYEDRSGNTLRVGFQVLETLRDGRGEGHHMKAIKNGQRVYLGKEDTLLKPGVYIYTLTYATNRQIGYFDDFDELYWNVTGDAWDFVIERAQAVIELPPGAYVVQQDAYTGPRGAKGKDFLAGANTAGNMTFATTRPLKPGEGLTIAVAWPKGIVDEPSGTQKAAYLLRDSLANIIGLIGLLMILSYYLFAWDRVGRDPRAGPIIPLFEPPEGLSPAAARFVLKMGFDDKSFASAVVSMAVKGCARIEDSGDDFTVAKTDGDVSRLSAGERAVYKKLLSGSASVVLKNTNHKKIGGAQDALKDSLEREFETVHFKTNSKYLIPGALLSLFTAVGAVVATSDMEGMIMAGFVSLWLTVWSAGCMGLFAIIIKGWKEVLSGKHNKIPSAVSITLFALPFFGGEAMGIFFLTEATSVGAALFLVMVALMYLLFYTLLKAPTLKGRRIMDRIEGFKMYLSVAEKERLEFLHPPEQTPELFEKYLPYALALDVEHQWSEHFSEILAASRQDGGGAYRPGWYGGSGWDSGGCGGLADNLGGSFSSALGSSTSAPGSSGSGGGGSSGGGGGGGGGGGW